MLPNRTFSSLSQLLQTSSTDKRAQDRFLLFLQYRTYGFVLMNLYLYDFHILPYAYSSFQRLYLLLLETQHLLPFRQFLMQVLYICHFHSILFTMKSFIQRGSLSSNVTSFLGTNLEKMFIIVSLKIEICFSVLTVLLMEGRTFSHKF